MWHPRQLYRYVRPFIANASRRMFDSHILTRAELLSDPPNRYTVYSFGTDERYEFESPRRVGSLPTVIKSKAGECTVPKPFVVEIEDATVIGPSALVSSGRYLFLESTLGSYERLVDTAVRASLGGEIPFDTGLQRASVRHDEPVFLLVGPWSTEYYHWLTDYLVQIFAVEVYRKRTGNKPLILIPKEPPTWLRESLSLVGIESDRIIEWAGTRAEFSNLIVGGLRRHTASTGNGYIHSPAAMARLGERLRIAVSEKDIGIKDKEPTRLYVSRADAADRCVRNEDELMSMLDEYSFERIIPGEHTFAEQVRRFADAEMIIGPHGAGLTNMIFAEETTLVELFGSYRNACFFALAQGMGYEYVSVTCHQEGSDLIADIDAIEPVIIDQFE